MTLSSLAADLRTEAERANERRALVLSGPPDATRRAAVDAIEAADLPIRDCTAVSAAEDWPFEHVGPRQSRELLGRTQRAIVVDGHDECSPNAVGRTVGAVDGGGLYVLLAPDLDTWGQRRDAFDESLAVPPFGVDDVTGNFRDRLVETLRTHPGIAICEVDNGYDDPEGDAVEVRDDGLTDPWPARPRETPEPPADARFRDDTYRACRTVDQAEAVHELEALRHDTAEGPPGVVVEADRGRGKSSAAGLAAGALAREGRDVLVTAPDRRGADEVFARARERLEDAEELAAGSDDRIDADSGGCVRFARPPEAADLPEDPDAVVVDEAAALPVSLLERFLDGPPVAFCTTVHGYEGAGRSFDVRFRRSLVDSEREVIDVRLDEPIRYAAGDPVESWAFRALLLDARPPVDQLVADAIPETVTYEKLTRERLLADEHLLREAFGLLVLAHYRTEPDDLARLLDAPNLTCRALLHEGRVVSVALLAREGGLSEETRERVYRGERVRGNMLPDVFTSQLRDRGGGEPVGYRVMRIATHHAVRSDGLGSLLLSEVEDEFRSNDGRDADLRGEQVDYFGVGYGATPELLDFWRGNGYRTVHLSTTKNDASGEHSALMVRPLTDDGAELAARHARWFRERAPGVLAGPLSGVDPDVIRRALRAVDDGAVPAEPSLSERDWRVVVDAANGMGSYHAAPAAFTELALRELIVGDAGLDPSQERLLVEKVLQNREWDAVAEDLDRVSTRMTMRAFGDACEPLVEVYGTEAAKAHREYWPN
ncbi:MULTISPECIES: tRNA(Met) cytidine acetyltransferase TmcA [Halolamina]|uniref:tRNA(Met) cytidine acetyltransferase TmcA n=1 Tax=Halolamina pelagica TaxID=699431 RepID=A0A1I5QB04_9EURY|nr:MULTISPECIES: tRNA(Met) cytidine acetyltransferase TmcA [Halolamina]NHX35183.1 tRNA(Met) cytidine acetyltransferase [Halolamina sp. R1-12]SFP43494.1 tRNA(Met) cytidine acetyltransferase [Halolamina pelagica]